MLCCAPLSSPKLVPIPGILFESKGKKKRRKRKIERQRERDALGSFFPGLKVGDDRTG